MKKILLFFLCMLLAASSVYADDEPADDSITIPDQQSGSTPVVVDITQLLNNQNNNTEMDPSESEPQEVYVLEPELISVTTQQQRITAADTTGLKAVMLTLLGDYETTVTDYEYRTGSSQYTSHSISIERDWSWICSCGVFGILLWCTFRSIGGILCRA